MASGISLAWASVLLDLKFARWLSLASSNSVAHPSATFDLVLARRASLASGVSIARALASLNLKLDSLASLSSLDSVAHLGATLDLMLPRRASLASGVSVALALASLDRRSAKHKSLCSLDSASQIPCMCTAERVLLPNAEADLLAGVSLGGPTGLGGMEVARGGGG